MRLLLNSPVGLLLVRYGAEAVQELRFWPQGAHPPSDTRDAPARGDDLGRQVAAELGEYFSGVRRSFDLPLEPDEGTPFQREVWEVLSRIPYGETRFYVDVAREAGRPGGARAVGQANARNPLPILIPCHRVLAAGGRLGGYLSESGDSSGTAVKRWLLALEQAGSGIFARQG